MQLLHKYKEGDWCREEGEWRWVGEERK